MEIALKRTQHQDKQVLGEMVVNGRTIKTLELAWKGNQQKVSCIPTGTYSVVKRNSAKYGDHFHVLDVPNRSFILIHHGNYHTDILGCILVGFSHADINKDGYLDVTNSRAAMKYLNDNLPNEFSLRIEF